MKYRVVVSKQERQWLWRWRVQYSHEGRERLVWFEFRSGVALSERRAFKAGERWTRRHRERRRRWSARTARCREVAAKDTDKEAA